MSNPLITNRAEIFAAALKAARPGSRIIDPGCPLTRYGNMVDVGVARGHGRNARVSEIAVNVETFEAYRIV